LSDEETSNLRTICASACRWQRPCFDGAREADIERMLELAGLNKSGQSTLIDGAPAKPSIAR
jgi:DNA-directed RNA polymerase subunit beta